MLIFATHSAPNGRTKMETTAGFGLNAELVLVLGVEVVVEDLAQIPIQKVTAPVQPVQLTKNGTRPWEHHIHYRVLQQDCAMDSFSYLTIPIYFSSVSGTGQVWPLWCANKVCKPCATLSWSLLVRLGEENITIVSLSVARWHLSVNKSQSVVPQ